jgi:NAD-dependent dihydropyrimidine dehydrogenase PreA subunit
VEGNRITWVLECPCRASAKQPCTPSMVCMVIGKPFTDLVLEHHPHKSKRLTETDALQLLEEVHRQGCIHSAFFKDACLDRFYVICNCCKCCCCGVEAMVKFGMPIMAPSGFSARIDANLCVKCGACQKRCPFGAISVFGEVIHEKCMGCGVCISSCKKNAVTLQKDETKGIPLDVSVL